MIIDSKMARNLSFRHLRAFVCVAHSGSFTAAAKQLAMSQPALTLNVRQFEEIVGVKLLTRTTRRVELTTHGREFLPLAEKFLTDLNNAIMAIRTKSQQQENRIDIALLPSLAIRLLPTTIHDFAKISPEIIIKMHDDNGRGVESQVLGGESDFGLSNTWSNHPQLEFTPLIRDRVGLICHADHPLAKSQIDLKWSDLNGYDFVGMDEDTGIRRIFQSIENLPESVTSPAYCVLTIVALVGLLESGNAISALPALAAPDYLNPSLVYRDLSSPTVHRQLGLITHRERPPSTAAQTFQTFLLQQPGVLCAMFPNNTVVAESPEWKVKK